MKPPRLTNYEKETIILFNEGEETAEIYTFNYKLIKKIKEKNKAYPEIFKIVKVGVDGEITCELPKSKLSIVLVPPISKEESEKRSRRAKESQFLEKARNHAKMNS